MKIFIKFDFTAICNKVLKDTLETFNIKYKTLSFGEIEFLEKVSKEQLTALNETLKEYGSEIVENQKSILVQKIKDTIIDMVFNEDSHINVKSSVYLSEKLEHSYGYLSNLFSEVTFTSIENFIILQKIEYTKQLIIKNELTLTDIAYKLNYSSVAHLSTQFKNTTGITPSAFQRIITKRRELTNK
ncbi:helix-turn-helix transcriptional regulator [Polaribacter batillariae]|uniref:Helix-turn-helix transcriptional regulator n=1 Tax=Polaribacter batillariae TaxID=2808900 RepID=A0ABX7SQJ6_9FLAO|nr:AraC family transcriptional regulator [Polaribacter batillariae]QTD36497.1 helix-turn-helix transcriptional regulator [Polaribacter batillariae]